MRGAYTNVLTDSGINRNILECKVYMPFLSRMPKGVLIETYWNVKAHNPGLCAYLRYSINRNILECKEFYADGIAYYVTSGINRNILECKAIR